MVSKPVLKYFGSKWLIALWIIKHFPAHDVYVEPFGGSAAVLLQKPRSRVEIYNDIDGDLVEFFKVLRDNPDELARLVALTPMSRSEFELCISERGDTPIERARRFAVASWQCRVGGGTNATSGNWWTSKTINCTHPATRWANLPDRIRPSADRPRGVAIECRSWIDVCLQYDTPDTLHYIDPPYVVHTRASGSYSNDLDDRDHHELVDVVSCFRGSVVLSGYENEIYDRLTGWRVVKRTANTSAGSHTECLWINERGQQSSAQQSLFGGE